MNRRRIHAATVIMAVLALLAACTSRGTSPTTQAPEPTGPAVAGFGAPGGIRTLTDAPAGCTVTEGGAATCTITISPAAPAGSSVTFSLTPRITGQGAYTVRDSNKRPVGGTGADITTTNGGTSYCIYLATGATSVTFPIQVIDDAYAELNETIVATLSTPTGVTLGTSSTTITIVDNDRTGIYDPVTYGATANNSANDDYTGIQAAINAAQAGSGRGVVNFGTAGTYDVYRENNPGNGQVLAWDPSKGVTFVGYGATIKRKGACAGATFANRCSHRLLGTTSEYTGAADTAWSVVDGLTFDGNRAGLAGPWVNYESEQSHSLFISGLEGNAAAGRVRAVAQNITDRNSPGDGISVHSKVQFTGWNNHSTDDFRGGFTLTGGYTIIRIDGWTTVSTNPTYPTGIDTEIDGFGGPGGSARTDFEAKNLVIDGDLDVGSFLPSWAHYCVPNGCGGGSTMTFDNLQMVGGSGVTVSTHQAGDQVIFKNSTLRWSTTSDQLARIVWAAGVIRFEDTVHVFTNDAPPLNVGSSGLQGIDIYWKISGYTKGLPAKVTFLRNTFTDNGTNTCIRQLSQHAQSTLEFTDSGARTFDCASPGYTGTATVSGSGSPNTTTTSSIPANQLACDGSPPTTTTSTTTTTTTTTAPTTTTTPPTTNRVQVESCTLGADATIVTPDDAQGTAIYGNNSVGTSTEVTCTVTNDGATASYGMTIRYQDTGSFIRNVTVNGVNVPASPGLTFTNSSGAWATVVNDVPLNVGSNTIKINTSYLTVDWFEFTAATLPTTTTTTTTTIAPTTTTTIPLSSDCIRKEAEDGATLVAWTEASAVPGANDGEYIGDTNFAGSAQWSVTVAAAGNYEIRTRAITGGSGASRGLTIGGVSQGSAVWPVLNDWAVASLGEYVLAAGANTIKLDHVAVNGNAGALYLDYIDVCLVPEPATTTTTTIGTTPPPSAPTTTTTIIPAGTRQVTLVAFRDANRNGNRNVGDGPMPGTRWRIRNAAGLQLAGGTISTPGTATVTVSNGTGIQVLWYPPAGATLTTTATVTLPATGSTTVVVGGCCPRAV